MTGGDQRLDVDQAHETRLGGQLSAHALTTIRRIAALRTFSAACYVFLNQILNAKSKLRKPAPIRL
jgi:hypothetical protein